ncbi:NAD regulator [uncultured Maricaulis sp.]|uniref:NUDIX hydrolase n=1 Tax=uncultured Maricaulis sp. TaxID=174710 RepID=UPI0030DDC94E|tara:strand:- start:32735 stop:33697 length:963 start_codon:yes stop_codon:yes gene_type:complete
MPTAGQSIVVGLNAVILAADPDQPQVLIVPQKDSDVALPFGPFNPAEDRTFEIGLRRWVAEQARFQLGYVEQLYTFGDRGREAPVAAMSGQENSRIISVGYLGLTPVAAPPPEGGGQWRDWYRFFPWEDWRNGKPDMIDSEIVPRLRAWADEAGAPGGRASRHDRLKHAFGLDDANWNEQHALDRFELLYEAGLVDEAARDGQTEGPPPGPKLGQPMASDHRRILATAIMRLRGKVRYRPIVFELMPEFFTLSALQQVVEGIVGYRLHKQNFRRALDRTGFVEGTGRMEVKTGGRPAELFRYRRIALAGQPSLGLATPRL